MESFQKCVFVCLCVCLVHKTCMAGSIRGIIILGFENLYLLLTWSTLDVFSSDIKLK